MATGNRIRELREKRGLRLIHVAAEFEVDQSTAWRWEQGTPPADVIPRLARFLGADPSYMMGWESEAA